MYLGEYEIDEYVELWVTTHRFSSGAAYAATSITYRIYEDGNTTEIITDTTMGAAFDSVTGLYLIRLQLTVAAGFEVGKSYAAVIQATVDSVAAISVQRWRVKFPAVDVKKIVGQGVTCAAPVTVLASVGTAATSTAQTGDSYPIVSHVDYGNAKLVRSTTPANTLSVDASNKVAVPDTQKVDVETIKTRAITCAAGVTVLANVGFAGAPGANNGAATTNGTKLNQTVDLTAGQSIACSDKTGFSLSATGADLILKSSTFVQAIVAAINEFATYGLTALNTLLVTTGIKAATVPNVTLADGAHGGASTVITLQTPIVASVSSVPDSSGVTTLLGQLTGITSLANWLRGLFRKDAMNATAKTEVNTGGGAYDEATDSVEAIVDNLATEADVAAEVLAEMNATPPDVNVASIDDIDFTATQLASLQSLISALMTLTDGVETGINPAQALQVILAYVAGKTNGGGTATLHFRDQADGKNRITMTPDADGNRSSVTLDLD